MYKIFKRRLTNLDKMYKSIGSIHLRNLNNIIRITKPCQLSLITPKHKISLFSTSTNKRSVDSRKISKQNDVYTVEHLTDPNSGAIKEMPRGVKLGNFKMLVAFTVFTLLGAKMANVCTTYLEANDIFSPQDDDDDDEEW